MPQVSLKEYAASIVHLIQGGNIDGAIAHCRHILSHYPKYLPAYRLLARACLEKGDLAHASHFFQCVLSVDPEDADAWMNLALLSDDLGELEQATWLMERAFDVVPGNARVRNHLRQLYARRDGVDRSRIKLSGGALARLYSIGGFHRQAADELQKLLQAGTELPPLHVAQLEVTLATALWHSTGMALIADEVCHSLTSKFPNCIQANLIMAQIRTSAGKDAEAAPYLAVVRSVDPEGSYAFDLLGDQSPLPQESIEIPYLESDVQPAMADQTLVTTPVADDTSWLDGIGEAIEAAPESVSPASAEAQPPAWLQEWSADQSSVGPSVIAGLPKSESSVVAEESAVAAAERPGVGIPRASGAEDAEPAAEEDLPDWLRELGTEPATEMEQEIALGPTEGVLPIPDVETETEVPVEGLAEPAVVGLQDAASTPREQDLPEWLQELTVSAPAEAEAQLETGAEQAAGPTAQDKVPDWLAELGAAGEGIEPQASTVAAGIAAEEAEPKEQVGRAAEPSLTIEPEELAEPLIPVDSAAERVAEEELPDWLRELRPEEATEESTSPEEQVAVEPVSEDALPTWLREMEPEVLVEEQSGPTLVSETPAETLAELEPPDWLKELQSQESAAEATLSGEERKVAEVAEEAEPATWLGESETQIGAAEAPQPADAVQGTPEPTADEALPDWLQELRSEGVVEELVAPADEQMAVEPAAEEELPVWLRDLSPQAEAEEPAGLVAPVEAATEHVTDEELPDWLRELRSEGVVEELVSPEEQVAVEPAAEEELPAWLRELEPEALGEEEAEPSLVGEVPSEAPIESQAPDWLRRLETEDEVLLEEESVAADSVTMQQIAPVLEGGPEEMPEWLAQEGTEPGLPVATVAPEQIGDQAAAMPHALEPQEGMPSWLSELEAEIAALPASAGVSEPSGVPEAAGFAAGLVEQEPVALPMEPIADEGNQPGEVIAEEVLAGEPAVVDELEPVSPAEAGIVTPKVEIPPVSTGMPEWLTELEQELGERTTAPAHKMGEAEGLVQAGATEVGAEAAWLEELAEPAGEVGAPAEDTERAEAVQEQPEWLGAPLDGHISEITVEEMPDWLRQLHAAEPVAEQAEAGETSPLAEDVVQLPATEEIGSPSDQPQVLTHEVAESQLTPTLDVSSESSLRSTMEEVAPREETLAVEPAIEAPQALRYLVEPGAAQDDYQARIAMARAYARVGNLDASTDEYEQLAKVVSVSDILIKDLENLVASYPDHHALHRVLGDAYMRAGRLQEALNAYKEALIRL